MGDSGTVRAAAAGVLLPGRGRAGGRPLVRRGREGMSQERAIPGGRAWLGAGEPWPRPHHRRVVAGKVITGSERCFFGAFQESAQSSK